MVTVSFNTFLNVKKINLMKIIDNGHITAFGT